MRIDNLTYESKDYTCNVYLVRGDWNNVGDVNTLIDVGADVAVIPRIKARLAGIGQKKIDQILVTHGDLDHIKILPDIKAVFNPVIYGSNHLTQVDKGLENGQEIKIGNKMFEIVHPDIHGIDSLCFMCREESIIFTGDAPIHRCHQDGDYTDKFLNVLEMLTRQNIEKIYPGHGPPILNNASEIIMASFIKAKEAKRNPH